MFNAVSTIANMGNRFGVICIELKWVWGDGRRHSKIQITQ